MGSGHMIPFGTSVEKITQAPDFELNENINLMWTERGKAWLILIFGTNTNRESVAYRSFSLWEFQARDVRKVTGLWLQKRS